jgi:hypothetical protein
MALDTKECINSETMPLLQELYSLPFHVGYARVGQWRIVLRTKMFEAEINLYADEETRNKNIDACLSYFIGCNLTDSILAKLQDTDDRNILYGVIEYLIHYNAYSTRLIQIQDDAERLAFVTEYNARLDELDNDLGFDLYSLFQLNVNMHQ